MGRLWFITHPDVVIAPDAPVPEWRLSERGLARMQGLAGQTRMAGVDAVWSSAERKAIEAGDILAARLGLARHTLASLGENDRSSTGYLPRDTFEAMADAFFARPTESVQGWERAVDAQARIVAAVETVIAASPGAAEIAVVAHGAVGALYLCHVTGQKISRKADQPPGAGGFLFVVEDGVLAQGWRAIDAET